MVTFRGTAIPSRWRIPIPRKSESPSIPIRLANETRIIATCIAHSHPLLDSVTGSLLKLPFCTCILISMHFVVSSDGTVGLKHVDKYGHGQGSWGFVGFLKCANTKRLEIDAACETNDDCASGRCTVSYYRLRPTRQRRHQETYCDASDSDYSDSD